MENDGDDNQVEEKDKEGEEERRVLLEKNRRLYELSKRDGGEFSTSAIIQGINYADLLHSHSIVKSSRLIPKYPVHYPVAVRTYVCMPDTTWFSHVQSRMVQAF